MKKVVICAEQNFVCMAVACLMGGLKRMIKDEVKSQVEIDALHINVILTTIHCHGITTRSLNDHSYGRDC